MDFLGTYKITPNNVEIEVDCFGMANPGQPFGLEQEPISAYNELERVECNGIDITDFLSDNILDDLNNKVNEK